MTKKVGLLSRFMTIVLIINNSCSMRTDTKFELGEEVSNNVKNIITEWKRDSSGCLNLRNKEKGELLVDSLNLMMKKRNEIENIIGKPNKILYGDEKEIIRYFFNSGCTPDRTLMLDSVDYCMMDIMFKNDSIIDISYTCQ